MTLWHFTSLATAPGIEREGFVQPGDVMLRRAGLPPLTEGGRYVWLIDLPNPTPRLLGFSDSSAFLAARFAVVDASAAVWWPSVRRRHTQDYLDLLESFAMPGHWWVAEQPVPVTRDTDWRDPSGLLHP